MSRRSCCGALPIVAYVAGAAERINRMRQPTRETFEAEATRLRDEPGRDGAVGPLIPRLQEPVLTPHVAMSLVQELGSTVVGNPCSVPSQMAGG